MTDKSSIQQSQPARTRPSLGIRPMSLRNMNIAPRAFTGFALIGGLMLVLGVFALNQMSKIRAAGEDIATASVPSIKALDEFTQLTLRLRVLSYRLLINREPDVQQKTVELFVLRNVANMVPPYQPDDQYHSTSAALEYAVQVLRVKDIVVMGHGRCGGIQAALDPMAEPLSPGDFIGKWMSLVKAAAEQIQNNDVMTAAERQTALERVAIRNSIRNLRTFPCVQILEGRGKIQIHGAWFDIANGELWVMDGKTGDFMRPDAPLPEQP